MSWMQDNWPMLTGFLIGAVTWGKTTNDVAKNKEDIKTALTDIGSMKDAIARIEVHQKYSRDGIDDIKTELRSLRESR